MRSCRPSHVLYLVFTARGFEAVLASSVGNTEHQCFSEEEWRSHTLLNFSGAVRRCGPHLFCVEGHPSCEEFCTRSEECQRFPLNQCSETSFICQHKRLFADTAGPDIGAAFLFFGISGLALSAGIGGGGLYVPLLTIILGFSVHQATALSQACLAGGSSSALVYNLRQHHPSGDKPMIDYDLVLIMGPMLLAGAVFGSIMNSVAPSWLIALMLVVVLTHSAYKAFEKAITTWRKESPGELGLPQDARLSKNPIDRCMRLLAGQHEHGSLPPMSAPAQISIPKQVAVVAAPAVDQAEIDLDIKGEPQLPPQSECSTEAPETIQATSNKHPQFPREPLILFITTWAVVLLSIFARGGPATSGLVPYCSSGYWSLAMLTAAVLAFISLVSARRTIDAHAKADAIPAAQFDSPTSLATAASKIEGFEWSQRGATRIMLWSLLAGTLAAMCGIGGGMIMGPRLLDLGFSPQVQSATTATTLFVMSTSTCLAFLVEGIAPADYACWLALATSMGAVVGKTIVGWIVKKFRRPSVIMFILAGIIATSVIVMSLTAIIDVADDLAQGQDMGLRSPCHAEIA